MLWDEIDLTPHSQTDNYPVPLCPYAGFGLRRGDYHQASDSKALRQFCMAEMSRKYSPQILEAIRRRATELYLRCGGIEGHDEENWYKAEAEIIRETSTRSARRAVVVNIQGVVYTGEYEFDTADGYTPGEWQPGDPVPIRLAGDKLYLRRRNGRELQTTVVKRIG